MPKPLEVLQSPVFRSWFSGLRDQRARQRITTRIGRIAIGLMGDVRSLGDGLSEIRIDYGPGYRLYYTLRGSTIMLLLCGGDKGSQERDIATARAMISQK